MPPSVAAGGLLPVDVTNTPAMSVEGPRSVPSRISVVLVDGTVAGDTPGRVCPLRTGIRYRSNCYPITKNGHPIIKKTALQP